MKNILSTNPKINIHNLQNDRKIAEAIISKVETYGLKLKIINRTEEFKMGDSVQCRFKYKNQKVRFNAKIKDSDTIFLLGELIFDDEKNYLRVDDDIKISYKKIKITEVDRYINEVFKPKDDFTELISLLDRKDPYFKVIEYLISRIDYLNESINNLTDIITDKNNKDFQKLFVNISASGIKIKKKENIKKGDILFIEMKIELNLRNRILKIIGEVIRTDDDYFTIEYRMISNSAKETLIRYALEKERVNILSSRY